MVQRPADLLGRSVDEPEIGIAVELARRRADRDHDHVGISQRFIDIGGETEPILPHALADDSLQPRLIDREDAGVQSGDLVGGTIDACHVHAHGRQAGAADQADISGSDHCQVHRHISRPVDLGFIGQLLDDFSDGAATQRLNKCF